MADPQSVFRPAVSETSSVGGCPCVADLIHYGLGQAGNDERKRIEAHLNQSGCPVCLGWIDKAARLRGDPRPNDPANPLPADLFARHLAAPPPLTADQTPIPESSKWQRQAFRELERRLLLLKSALSLEQETEQGSRGVASRSPGPTK